MQLRDAAAATAGSLIGADAAFGAVSTDTRSIGAGELFVALRGENFDGHAFVAAAFERGAAGALVERAWAESQPQGSGSLVAVEDTRLALGTLGGHWRSRFDLPLIGVTGSNGKTTVKEMCAAILRAQTTRDGHDSAAVLATQGNLNNDIGVPLMLLRLNAGHRWAVIEMGMNHPGEIAYLAELTRPTVALVNNAQHAHLEGMGSVAEVAREKGCIYGGLGAGGVAVINADDAFADYWRRLNGGRRTLTFGLAAPADVRGNWTARGLGSELELSAPQGAAGIALRVPGVHNGRNALAAAAACLAAGAELESVKAGLEAFSGVRGRLQQRRAHGGATLLDDTYNANPDSVRAAIDVLSATAGRKILVLGDMGEIGSRSGQFHDEIGGYAKSQGIDRLFALGELAELAARNFGSGGAHFATVDELVATLSPELGPDTVVLVKGSRFMRMERVADAVARDQAGGAHAA